MFPTMWMKPMPFLSQPTMEKPMKSKTHKSKDHQHFEIIFTEEQLDDPRKKFAHICLNGSVSGVAHHEKFP